MVNKIRRSLRVKSPIRFLTLATLVIGIFAFSTIFSDATLFKSFVGTLGLSAATVKPECQNTSVPTGALAGQPLPMWCYEGHGTGPSTFTQGTNSWVDDFNHGLSMSLLGDGYVEYPNVQGMKRSFTWRHANHWMVDVEPGGGRGGTMIRPNRSFQFEDLGDGRGKTLIVEADVAATIDSYGSGFGIWPEIDITTASQPKPGRDTTYGYDMFANDWTVGCRLHNDGVTICALWNKSGAGSAAGGRVWEVSFFQNGGASSFSGGYPSNPSKNMRFCTGTDPDLSCRDRYRWEISKNSTIIYVNGVKYMEHRGFPGSAQLPDEFLNAPVYVYFASWMANPTVSSVRFHWDRLAVNPGTPPSSAIVTTTVTSTPSQQVTATLTKTPTPTPRPTNAASITLTMSPTPTQVPSQGGSVVDIYAAGEPGQNVYPSLKLNLLVDGGRRDVFTVKSVDGNAATAQFKKYTFVSPTKITIDNKPRIRFTNDYCLMWQGKCVGGDRNLRVQKIVIDGVEYKSISSSTYSRGSWSPDNGCGAGYKESEWLNCNGYFEYALPTSNHH